MRFDVLTLFPNQIINGINYSIIKRAMDNGLINVGAVDIRNYSKDKHRRVDDYPFGGGPGMVMTPQPIYDCIQSVKSHSPGAKVIYMSPQGMKLNQQLALDLSSYDHLLILCGHYEGIDQRVIDSCVDMELSIGDYVLTGGELGALVLIDCISRLIPGVLSGEQSFSQESFFQNRLEFPQYTRPRSFNGVDVPAVLLSGHHEKIEEWRLEQSLSNTLLKRPDLLVQFPPNEKEQKIINKLDKKK